MDDVLNVINFELNEELTLEHRKNTILEAKIAAYKNREEELEKKSLELTAQLTRANTRLEILQKTTKSLHEELRAGSQNVEPIVLNIQINEALALPTLDASVQTNIMPAPQAGDASMIPHSVVLGAMAVGKLFAKVPLTPGNLSAAAAGGYLTYELFGANLLGIPVSPLSRPIPSLGQWIWTTVKPKPKLTVPANCRPKEYEGTQAAVIGISPIPIVPPVPTEL